LLQLVLEKLVALGGTVSFVHSQQLPLLRRYLKAKLNAQVEASFRQPEDIDSALEKCEDELLASVSSSPGAVTLKAELKYELFDGLSPDEIAIITSSLQRRSYAKGAVIINAGDEARELFFLAEGHVSVLVKLPSGSRKRLATFTAGMAFGEMAVIDHAPRSAMIVADDAVTCDLLMLEELEKIGVQHPNIKIKLLENLCLGLCRKLRKANRELSLLE
jgi:glutaminase